MDFEIRHQPDLAFYRNAVKKATSKHRRTRILLECCVVIVAASLYGYLKSLGWVDKHTMYQFLLFLIIVPIFFVFIEWRLASVINSKSLPKWFAELDNKDVVCHFDDSGFFEESPTGTTRMVWRYVEKVMVFPEVLLLFISPLLFHAIPTSSLTEEQRDFIIRKVKENSGKVI